MGSAARSEARLYDGRTGNTGLDPAGETRTHLSILYLIPETDIKYLQKQIFNICFSIQLNLKNCISPVEQLHTDTNRQRENKSPNNLK